MGSQSHQVSSSGENECLLCLSNTYLLRRFSVDRLMLPSTRCWSVYKEVPVVLQIAHKYLAEKNLSPADDTKFKEQLYRIWFELYARRGSSRWVDLSLPPPEESGTTMETL